MTDPQPSESQKSDPYGFVDNGVFCHPAQKVITAAPNPQQQDKINQWCDATVNGKRCKQISVIKDFDGDWCEGCHKTRSRVTALGALGSSTPSYYRCNTCSKLYDANNKGLAVWCCSPDGLKAKDMHCMQEGCTSARSNGFTLCRVHQAEVVAARTKARFDKATMVECSGDQVTNGEGDYYLDLDDYVDQLEPGTEEHFIWCTKPKPFLVDADDIVNRLVEDWWNTDDGEPTLFGMQAFREACKAFQEANAKQYLLEVDFSRKIRVPATPTAFDKEVDADERELEIMREEGDAIHDDDDRDEDSVREDVADDQEPDEDSAR